MAGYFNSIDDTRAGEYITEDIIQEKIKEITKQKNIFATDSIDTIRDTDWIKDANTATVVLSGVSRSTRFVSLADSTFEEAGIGSNVAINPLPQFTRYADVRSTGLAGTKDQVEVARGSTNIGMGHYYAEAFNSTQHTIHMRFGVPEYNSMISFFTGFFSTSMANDVRSGGIIYKTFYTVAEDAATLVALVHWRLVLGVLIAGKLYRFLFNKPATKYYYLRPTMGKYWMAVNTMFNQIVVYKRMTPINQEIVDVTPSQNQVTTATTNALLDYFKDFTYKDDITGNLYFDVYKIAGRHTFRLNQVNDILKDKLANYGYDEMVDYLEAMGSRSWAGDPNVDSRLRYSRAADEIKEAIKSVSPRGIKEWIVTNEQVGFGTSRLGEDTSTGVASAGVQGLRNPIWSNNGFEAAQTVTEVKDGKEETKSNIDDIGKSSKFLQANGDSMSYVEPRITSTRAMQEETKQAATSFTDLMEVEFEDGTAFATFRVDNPGSADESWSNQTGESSISSAFNSISAKARDVTFNLMGGNIDNGIITGVIDAAKGLLHGALDSFHLSGLLSLGGAAFVDIPQQWENSSANLPRMNYTMQLFTPYGNPIGQLLYVHLPMCMLLAAALPISTGHQSYTSPFLLELYDRGRAQTRLGIMDSLSFTRGTTELPFNKDRQFMSVDVSFSVKDLSSIMHMPLSTAGYSPLDYINPIKDASSVIDTLIGEDNVYNDYLHVLAGASLYQSVYRGQKLRDNVGVLRQRSMSLSSMSHWASWLHTTPIGLLDIFHRGTERQ